MINNSKSINIIQEERSVRFTLIVQMQTANQNIIFPLPKTIFEESPSNFPGQTPILSFCSGQLSGNLDVSRDNFFQKEFSDNFFPT